MLKSETGKPLASDLSWQKFNCSWFWIMALWLLLVSLFVKCTFWFASYQLWDTFKTTFQSLAESGTKASWAQYLYSTLPCLFSSICKVAECLQCTEVITSQAHFIQIIFTSQQKGEITQGIYHQQEQKVKVIIMSSQVILLTPKSQRLNIVLWRVNTGHERKGGGTVIERERDMLTDRKWEEESTWK